MRYFSVAISHFSRPSSRIINERCAGSVQARSAVSMRCAFSDPSSALIGVAFRSQSCRSRLPTRSLNTGQRAVTDSSP